MKHRSKIAGVVLVFAAFGSEALTFGRIGGAALIGQPLDLPIQVQMDAGEDASSLCFEADVFHADTRQDPRRVRVLVQAAEQLNVAKVRVLSEALVDEPVVTIYLRAGCGQKMTRRYVLLADFPSEVAAPSLPPPPVVSTPQAMADSPPVAPAAAATAATAAPQPITPELAPPGPLPATGTRARTVPPARPRPGRPVASKPKETKPARSTGQPRLQLDPLESLSKRIATLESSTPAAPPDDALREAQRTQALERDVKTLLALAAKNEASLVDLKARLQQAEAQRFPAVLVYGLSVLVLLCLAAVALLWTRLRGVQQQGGHWSRGSTAPPAPGTPPPEAGFVPEPGPADGQQDPPGASRESRNADLPMPLGEADASAAFVVSQVEMSESDFARLGASGAAARDIGKPSPTSVPVELAQAGKHNFSSEAVFDIRQQAEFFVSLGKTDQAMRVLERQILDSEEPNPYVYLDLLGIFHSLSLKTDFRQFRDDFSQLFNVRVPEFVFFKDEGRGLEFYPEVLSHITALWPNPKALEVIETCIFRDSWDHTMDAFDLAAFRDLLMLHAVGQTIGQLNPREERRPGAASPSRAPAAGFGEVDLDLSRPGPLPQ